MEMDQAARKFVFYLLLVALATTSCEARKPLDGRRSKCSLFVHVNDSKGTAELLLEEKDLRRMLTAGLLVKEEDVDETDDGVMLVECPDYSLFVSWVKQPSVDDIIGRIRNLTLVQKVKKVFNTTRQEPPGVVVSPERTFEPEPTFPRMEVMSSQMREYIRKQFVEENERTKSWGLPRGGDPQLPPRH